MELTVKKQIAAALMAYIETHNMTQADLAKRSGVQKAYVNIILKPDSDFKYDAGEKQGNIPDKYFNQLAEFIGLSFEKVYWEPKPTDQTVATLANLKDAKDFGLTIVVVGETGSGKSFTSEMFASKNPHDTYIIKVGSSDNLSDILDKVIDKIKIPAAKTKSAKLRDISRKMLELKNTGFKPQLIFDESEYMKQPALCAVKEIIDHLQGRCSVVLIGTDQLTDNLDRLRRRNKPGIPQFYRRIKFGFRILPPIDRSFGLFLQDITDRKLKSFLQKNCDNYGELHDALVPSLREADRLGEPLTEALVRKTLNIPESMYV